MFLYNSCRPAKSVNRDGRAVWGWFMLRGKMQKKVAFRISPKRHPFFAYLRKAILFYAPTLAALAKGAVRKASVTRPKYSLYERWMPNITGKTTKAACQPK